MGKLDLLDLVSQIRAMQQQEKSVSYRCTDYLSSIHNVDFSSSDRQALCDWGFKIIASCNSISRTAAVVAISYFDRFLGSPTPSAKRALPDIPRLQLAFVACLVIALKVEGGFNVETEFVSDVICRNMYDAQEINGMEIEILQALGWRLHGPTVHDFIDYFFEKMPYSNEDGVQKEMVVQFSKCLAELAVTEYSVALQLPSQVAFAAICCAVEYAAPCCLANSRSFLLTISGLDPDDTDLRSVINIMPTLLVRESHPAEQDRQESNTGRDRNDEAANSISSGSSPRFVAETRGL